MATQFEQNEAPIVIAILAGIAADPRHWLNIWARDSDDIATVSASHGEVPNRNNWVNNLNHAIQRVSRPVILVAEGLGCHVAAWWAELERPAYRKPVIGALLVSPVDNSTFTSGNEASGLVPGPIGILPFPSTMVCGRELDATSRARTKRLNSFWGSKLVESDFFDRNGIITFDGAWEEGKALLQKLGRQEPDDDGEVQKISSYRAIFASYPI